MQPQFTKFHGLGNDYLVIEADELREVGDLGEFAHRICNRHYGAGGDGIAIIAKAQTDEADFSCRIFNPDGSEAGLSGNGLVAPLRIFTTNTSGRRKSCDSVREPG